MCALRLRASVLRTVGKSIDAVAGTDYDTQNVKPESMRERKEDENDAPAMHKYVAHAGAASATSKTCSLAPAAGAVLKSTVAAAVEDANSLDSFSMSPLFFCGLKTASSIEPALVTRTRRPAGVLLPSLRLSRPERTRFVDAVLHDNIFGFWRLRCNESLTDDAGDKL